ncbi:PREDICTED: chymotrypsinogen B-like [Condylura cristata]|uniref:chymotrypsinogen B-like n=1 Tax=Condylura cristata TaxID=143302 RepID=UPI0003345FB3|nr:PREDICTED: chymotrypsinogen B-like [Condylura cristata]
MAFLWLLSCFALLGTTFGCGVSSVRPEGVGISRIINGKDALPGAWPWQVSLQDPAGWHLCGGSLISENWVLTAAHCQISPTSLVVAGITDLSSDKKNAQVLKVAQVFRKPADHSKFNDIALVKLATPANFTGMVSPVCLPKAAGEFPAGTMCCTTGWGRSNRKTSKLQQAYMPLLSHEQCLKYWGNISKKIICAGANGVSVCSGDSGGPLVCQKNGIWTLVGVTSMAASGCKTNLPNMFAYVNEFMPWIQETMEKN